MDTTETQLGDLVTAMHGPGQACDYGCSPAVAVVQHWADFAQDLETGKRIVAVSGWCWWDLEFPPHAREKIDALLARAEIKPVYLWANNVIFDTSRRFQPGSWVRTTALVKLHEHCIFETRNSLYLLVGSGTRAPVDIAIAHLLALG